MIYRSSIHKACKAPSGVQYSNTDHSWTFSVEGEDKEQVIKEIKDLEDKISIHMRKTFGEWANFTKEETLEPKTADTKEGETIVITGIKWTFKEGKWNHES